MKTTKGQEITIKMTGNRDMTPDVYSVYVDAIRVCGGMSYREAKETADFLARPTTLQEAWEISDRQTY